MVRLLKKFPVVKAGRRRDEGRPRAEVPCGVDRPAVANTPRWRTFGGHLFFGRGSPVASLITGRGRGSSNGPTLPYSDHRGPQRRILPFVSDCLLNACKDTLHSCLRRDAQLNRFGQKAAAQGLIMCDKRFK